MASGFFALLDDLGALMDDIAVTSKVAVKKTSSILGDDLAVNAEKSTGFASSRELPVLWAITKGSLLNKLIILPIAFLLNFFFPLGITIALVCGGVYLTFEGVEKVLEFFEHLLHKNNGTAHEDEGEVLTEKEKIKTAIKTDFILSIEIVIIAMSAVLNKGYSFTVEVATVSLVALIATVGVYGIVAIIVRMDDAGAFLVNKSKRKGLLFWLGRFLIGALPILIKMLAVVGTCALILVAGEIFYHHIPWFHHLFGEDFPAIAAECIFGISVGLIVVVLVKIFHKIFRK